MMLFNELCNKLLKSSREIVELIFAKTSLETIFRLGADLSLLNFYAKFMSFVDILEDPYDYMKEWSLSVRFPHPLSWKLDPSTVNLKERMLRLPVNFTGIESEHIWFLCHPNLFQCYLANFPQEMHQVLTCDCARFNIQLRHFIFYFNRFDLVQLLPQTILLDLGTQSDELYLKYSVQSQNLQMIQFLLDLNGPLCTVNKMAMYFAVVLNKLNIVIWLHENGHSFTTELMDLAATNGFFDIVKFQLENSTEGCTTDAIDGAARNEHLEVVIFLYENGKSYTTNSIQFAIQNNVTKFIEFFHNNRDNCFAESVNDAARFGYVSLAKTMYFNGDKEIHAYTLVGAIQNGYLNVVEWLFDTIDIQILLSSSSDLYLVQKTLQLKFEQGDFDMVKFLLINQSETVKYEKEIFVLSRDVAESIDFTNSAIEMVKWLCARNFQDFLFQSDLLVCSLQSGSIQEFRSTIADVLLLARLRL